jgi:hypothetical protein
VINQIWGPLFDLMGDGGFKAFSHAWLFIKAANLVEVVLVVVLFVVGMFVNIPGREIHQSGERP